jgi:hypothetical protein
MPAKRKKYSKWKQRLYRRRQKVYFWIERQFKLRGKPFATLPSEIKNNFVDRAILTGKKEMEKFLNKWLGPIPFYVNFKARRALKKQPNAIKLLRNIKFD